MPDRRTPLPTEGSGHDLGSDRAHFRGRRGETLCVASVPLLLDAHSIHLARMVRSPSLCGPNCADLREPTCIASKATHNRFGNRKATINLPATFPSSRL